MSYNRLNMVRLKKQYADMRDSAELAAGKRLSEVYASIKGLTEIDTKLAESHLALLSGIVKNGNDIESGIDEIRNENLILQNLRRELLVKNGYPADYTDVHYNCPECGDTGYIGVDMCDCLKRALVIEGIKSSGIGNLFQRQTFDTFDLEYYKSNIHSQQQMRAIFSRCVEYVDEFDDTSRNLLLIGNTGLGKTHLSTSIAGAVIERGFDVVYETVINLFSDFEAERFGKGPKENADSNPTEKYFTCDLLIIDDLGTELTNQFTVSVLYNLINTRLNRGKSTIINTNCTHDELRKNYDDRLTSRLFGEFEVMLFIGDDVRYKML